MEKDITEIFGRLTTLERDVKELKEKHKTIRELNNTLIKLDTTMDRILEDISALNIKVSNLERQDSDRYNHLVKTVVGAMITGVVGFIVGGWLR